MATPAEIRTVLEVLRGEYSPRKGWIDDELGPWGRAFASTDAEAVRRAMAKWLARGGDRVPKLAEFRRLVTTPTTSTAKGCGRCTAGFRDVSRHYRGRDEARLVLLMSARCHCQAGAGLPADIPLVEDLAARWRNMGGTLAVYLDPEGEQRDGMPRRHGSSAVIDGLRATIRRWQDEPRRAPERSWTDEREEVPL